jgi:hypothetical protein
MHGCVEGRDTVEMNVAMIARRRRIAPRQLDALTFDLIDGADVLAIEPKTSMCSLIFAVSAIYSPVCVTNRELSRAAVFT